MSDIIDLREHPQLLRKWMGVWNTPELTTLAKCEWSSRLRRSLGRAYPERMLVRLNLLLKEPKCKMLFEEVLCHELAHLAVYFVHGRAAAPHGTEWQELLRLAGYEPRRSFPTDCLAEQAARDVVFYDHVCPICQAKRTAKRRMASWRCVACQNAGLDGKLMVQSRPNIQEARNA